MARHPMYPRCESQLLSCVAVFADESWCIVSRLVLRALGSLELPSPNTPHSSSRFWVLFLCFDFARRRVLLYARSGHLEHPVYKWHNPVLGGQQQSPAPRGNFTLVTCCGHAFACPSHAVLIALRSAASLRAPRVSRARGTKPDFKLHPWRPRVHPCVK